MKNGALLRVAPHAPMGWRATSRGSFAMQGGLPRSLQLARQKAREWRVWITAERTTGNKSFPFVEAKSG